MIKLDYKDCTIKGIYNAMETGYIKEVICDGDSKTVIMEKSIFEDVFEALKESIKPIVDAVRDLGKAIANTIHGVANKKITKKKFIKLLQCEGIQRNEINKIIKHNKEPYTLIRYYTTLKNILK